MAMTLDMNVHHCLWSGRYVATLLGGEFDNCHGVGLTPEAAAISLRLTVRAKRNEQRRLKDEA